MAEPDVPTVPSVVDNMVLAMFVDADRVALLSALADGQLMITPGIVDPSEIPPFAQQPVAEFARGVFYFQGQLGRPIAATRLARRMAFYGTAGTVWTPAALSAQEVTTAHGFTLPSAWATAQAADPAVRPRRVDRGEAECAAVAVSRGWRLWSDDAAIVDLLGVLHPGHPVERISNLLARAVREGLLPCSAAADLYNGTFKGELGLWSRVSAACEGDLLAFG